jgi:predicted outer membrane lipoprotein
MDRDLYNNATNINNEMNAVSLEIVQLDNYAGYLDKIEIKDVDVAILLELLAKGFVEKEPIINALLLEIADLKAKRQELEENFESL